MIEQLGAQKTRLRAALKEILSGIRENAINASAWTPDLFARLEDYAGRGKMIRGGLVETGARSVIGSGGVFSKKLEAACLQIGAAMELIQSLLLIHDDIMDQDDLRRGKPSMHAQYAEVAAARNAHDPRRLGESLGICAGDVSGFVAFDILASLDLEPGLAKSLIQLTSRELTYVALAQMGDVYNAGVPEERSRAEILTLYRYKTGRYTFSLPLMAGALCAGSGPKELSAIADIGELFGILFQIKDDEIGLFGEPGKTGKPKGADILENKRTMHRLRFLEALDELSRDRALRIFGNRSASTADLDWVRERMHESGVIKNIDLELKSYAQECESRIDSMTFLNEFGKASFSSLLAYNLSRDY